MTKTLGYLIFVITLLVSANLAFAGAKMLFCLPGFPGSSESAQPYVDKMLRYLESKLSWKTGSAEGLYLPDGEAATATLLKNKPDIALVGPSIYAAHSKALKMRVIAKVEVNGRGAQTYSVVVRKSGPSSIVELSNQSVEGAVVHDEKYVLNVLLDRRVGAGQLKLKSEPRPLRALRNVARGKAGAAIVDGEVVRHMSTLPFAADLKIIYTSAPVPAPAIVVMNQSEKWRKSLRAELVGMCQKEETKELCKTLTLSSIKGASDADYKKLLRSYNR